MEFLTWTDEESVQNREIDEQHKELILLINKLHAHIDKDFNDDVKDLIQELIDHTRIHFDTEENLMKQLNYPNYISHKLEHDRFYNKLIIFSSALEDGTDKLSHEFFKSFKNWFYNHLELNDKKCGKYFTGHGLN